MEKSRSAKSTMKKNIVKNNTKKNTTNLNNSNDLTISLAKERDSIANLPSTTKTQANKATSLPVEKNKEYTIEITGLGYEGEGVGRVEGFTLFVKGALPGEEVRVRVEKTKKNFGYGKLLEVMRPSIERVEAPCPIYAQCGGCQLQHLSYNEQLRQKQQNVIDNLERIGKLSVARAGDDLFPGKSDEASSTDKVIVHPTIGMSDPWRYRNKAQVPIGEEEGGLIGGFYAQNSHRIVSMEACLIQHEESDRLVDQVKRIASEMGIRAYNEETGQGVLRHVVVKVGFHSGQLMVVLITKEESFRGKEKLVKRLSEEIEGLTSLMQNVNPARTNVIFGAKTIRLWGEEVIVDSIGGVQFAISARSFFQVNPVQTEVLYGKALEYAKLSGEETVIDAYCGIGTISLFLAQKAKKVYGVEIVPEAIADAKKNAELNRIGNVEFTVGEAETVIPQWKEKGVAADVIIVDPPRKGCEESLLHTIADMRPERVVYVSCNPSTLARDLRVLEDRGYRTVEVQPVDMFPWTAHVEAISSIVLDKSRG